MKREEREKLKKLLDELNKLIRDMMAEKRVIGEYLLNIYEMYYLKMQELAELSTKLNKIIEESYNEPP